MDSEIFPFYIIDSKIYFVTAFLQKVIHFNFYKINQENLLSDEGKKIYWNCVVHNISIF